MQIVDPSSLGMLGPNDVAEEGDVVLDEFADANLDGLLDTVTDQLKVAAGRIARNVAAANQPRLNQIGRKIAAEAIWGATEPLPFFLRSWLQPDFIPPKPSPQWVKNITDPLMIPVVKGAQAEATRTAIKFRTPLYLTIGGVVLTIFGVGYIVGSIGRKSENKPRPGR